jgi:hypothetical protein
MAHSITLNVKGQLPKLYGSKLHINPRFITLEIFFISQES